MTQFGILFISDDNKLAAEVARRLANERITNEPTGKCATATTRWFRPDLIVYDTAKSDLRRADYVRFVERCAATADTPIVFMGNGRERPADGRPESARKRDVYLPRPVRTIEIVQAIRDALKPEIRAMREHERPILRGPRNRGEETRVLEVTV